MELFQYFFFSRIPRLSEILEGIPKHAPPDEIASLVAILNDLLMVQSPV
jgi:hypothetical protein